MTRIKKYCLIVAVLFVCLSVSVFAQGDLKVLVSGEDYRNKPDGRYAEYDYSGSYVKVIYEIKDGMRQTEKRFNRYGKLTLRVDYKNDRPTTREEFYDIETFFQDFWMSMDQGCWKVAALLLIFLIGVLLSRMMLGIAIWSCVYFIVCLVIIEGIFGIAMKQVGYVHVSTFFNLLTLGQLLFFGLAFGFLINGIWKAFHKDEKAMNRIFIGIMFTFCAEILSIVSQYEHWGLCYMFVSNFKAFLFISLFSSALMIKLWFFVPKKIGVK